MACWKIQGREIMGLYTASLASGSNGNCYYVGSEQEAVLIDVGISCKEVERRMKRLGLDMRLVKAIFISHEHTDHILGVSALARKYELPVFVTPATAHGGRLNLAPRYHVPFDESKPVVIGQLTITPFKKHHDAWDPHSFTVSSHGVHVGVFTDIGVVCDKLTHHFSQCHAAFLESNYDEAMLEAGPYSDYLKNRIRSGRGHISNRQALDLFTTAKAPYLSHLFLSHLSRENNDPELAMRMFQQRAQGVSIIHASRYEESPVFYISGAPMPFKPMLIPLITSQLQLF